MTVKIVTDSSADLPAELVEEMGITVVPLYVRFGDNVYRDRVEMGEDEFYRRLNYDPVHPSTTQPTPEDFTKVYQEMVKDADGIVSIHISSKLSGTCNSAMQAREAVGAACPIEVIDSQVLTTAQGLIAISAAKMAQSGANMSQVVDVARQAVANVHLLALLDTLKYVLLGGRIGKAKALLGSILNVKPVLTLKDGEVVPAGQVRSRSKGIDRLVEFIRHAGDIGELAVSYNTTPDEAQALMNSVGDVFARDKIIMGRIGPVLGVHMGPGSLVVAYLEKISA